jgi:ribulose-bisphosphate carboxylase large chain
MPALPSSAQRIRATYWLETNGSLEHAASVLAGEQSTGTFVQLPDSALGQSSNEAAVVERITKVGEAASASLTVAGQRPGPCQQAIVEISWGQSNFGFSLPNLMATVAGNLFELRQITGLRLLALQLPDEWAAHFEGPQFGIAGTRSLAGRDDGPLIGTIIKPSVGLTPEETAAMVRDLCDGGIDFIKDDELQANGSHCPFAERVDAVMRVIEENADRTGRKTMYAFNITGELDEMLRHHDLVVKKGGTCVMVSLNSVGLVATRHLRRNASLPIHGHRNGWGYLTRSPALGFDYAAWQVFWRLAGVDHLHVNGLQNKFSEDDETVVRAARACLQPLFQKGEPGFEVMPVFSSGQWAGQAFDTYRALQSTDLIYACGGGIVAHPGGISAGVESIREAWNAARRGLTLAETAAANLAVRQAVEKFGK